MAHLRTPSRTLLLSPCAAASLPIITQCHPQVGRVLLEHFGGQAARLVEAAQGSAVRLVQLVAQYLPGFRDHAVYKGRQVRAGPSGGGKERAWGERRG